MYHQYCQPYGFHFKFWLLVKLLQLSVLLKALFKSEFSTCSVHPYWFASTRLRSSLLRAVTEAFVVVQISEMINNLTALPSQEAKVVGRLYKLVGYYLRCLPRSCNS